MSSTIPPFLLAAEPEVTVHAKAIASGSAANDSSN